VYDCVRVCVWMRLRLYVCVCLCAARVRVYNFSINNVIMYVFSDVFAYV